MIAVATGRGRASARAATGKLTTCAPGSACPVERRGECALSCVLEFHAERLDLRRGRACDGQSGVRRVEHTAQLGGLTTLLRSEVLDLDGDVVADLDAVAVPLFRVFDRQALDTEKLPDQWREVCHRTARLA